MLSSAEVDRAAMPLGGRGRDSPELELQHKVSDHRWLSLLWLSLSWVSMWGLLGWHFIHREAQGGHGTLKAGIPAGVAMGPADGSRMVWIWFCLCQSEFWDLGGPGVSPHGGLLGSPSLPTPAEAGCPEPLPCQHFWGDLEEQVCRVRSSGEGQQEGRAGQC